MVVNDDMTQEDKPIAIILPSRNPNEPRFIVEDVHEQIADDRRFKNGKGVLNQRLGFFYSVEEIVEVLNNMGEMIDELEEQLKEKREEEQLYANEILELREANKEFIQFKSLGGDY